MPSTEAIWKQARVLVTGGAGFVGRWLCKAIHEAGAEIHLLDLTPPEQLKAGFTFHRANLCNLEATQGLLAELRPSIIMHLAGLPGVQASHDNPVLAFESNVVAAFNLLEAARIVKCCRAIVAVSSNHVYGDQKQSPTSEDAPLNGHGMYAASKLASDVLARSFGKSYNLPVGIARITNSYGGDDHHVSHIVTATILSALRNEPPVIKQSGRDRKGYLYIADTVSGLMALAEGIAQQPALYGEAFNIVPDESITVAELVRVVLKTVGINAEPRILQPDAHYEEESLSNARSNSALGWRPRFGYPDGIKEAVQWYKHNPR